MIDIILIILCRSDCSLAYGRDPGISIDGSVYRGELIFCTIFRLLLRHISGAVQYAAGFDRQVCLDVERGILPGIRPVLHLMG